MKLLFKNQKKIIAFSLFIKIFFVFNLKTSDISFKSIRSGSHSELISTSGFIPVNPSSITETLDTVIINDDIKNHLKVIIKYFQKPEDFIAIGAKVPKGILFYGPPGTGKTSLGRAIAKETNCKFFYICGSELDGELVGTGANKIRELFKIAEIYAPCIIFIDEIDTIAKKRVSHESRFHSQTMQQLLVELDGFKKQKNPIIVIATTNNKDHLDKAMLRSGRFDLHINVPNPDYENRMKILMLYVNRVKIASTIDKKFWNEVALKSESFSGSDIENLINQAALNALMEDKTAVDKIHIVKALDQMQSQKNSEKNTDSTKFFEKVLSPLKEKSEDPFLKEFLKARL